MLATIVRGSLANPRIVTALSLLVALLGVSALLGYTYSHVSTGWMGVRKQGWLHMGVMLIPLAVLPLPLVLVASVPCPIAVLPLRSVGAV